MQASALDPSYARAYAYASMVYNELGLYGYMPSSEALDRAETAAKRALELDASLSEAHAAAGYYLGWLKWDFERAGEALRRAIELNSEY